MAPPSSGGIDRRRGAQHPRGRRPRRDLRRATQALHHYLEASALAFADRGQLRRRPGAMTPGVLDAAAVAAASRTSGSAQIDHDHGRDQAGRRRARPDGSLRHRPATAPSPTAPAGRDQEGLSTTHLTTADRWGNIVSYTLTIEQTGGSGIIVPGRGFLLNNELTDFNFAPTSADDPNAPGAGKRPRRSMSPTIVTRPDGKPLLASARRAARRSSRPSCRCCSTGSTSA